MGPWVCPTRKIGQCPQSVVLKALLSAMLTRTLVWRKCTLTAPEMAGSRLAVILHYGFGAEYFQLKLDPVMFFIFKMKPSKASLDTVMEMLSLPILDITKKFLDTGMMLQHHSLDRDSKSSVAELEDFKQSNCPSVKHS